MVVYKREEYYAKLVLETTKRLEIGSKHQKPLTNEAPVKIEDMAPGSKTFNQWTKTGVILSVGEHNNYVISADGSRSLSKCRLCTTSSLS